MASPRSTPCSNEKPTPLSPERQDVVIPRHDLRFQIPSNYESIVEEDYSGEEQILWIYVRNPTDVAFLDCAIEQGQLDAIHEVADVIVTIEPRPRDMQQLEDILNPWLYESRDFSQTHIGGEEAITWIEPSRTVSAYVTYHAALFHPDGQHLIRIFIGDYGMTIAPQDVEVLEMVIESFAFPRIFP